MKPLTDAEIAFIKLTNYTATVWQFDEWHRTIWGYEPSNHEIAELCEENSIPGVHDETVADFLENLHAKFNNIEDAISAENLAVYLFRTFLTREQMERMLQAPRNAVTEDGFVFTESAKFLQNWKYSFGFRKVYDADNLLRMALDPHWVETTDEDGDIWYDYVEDE